MANMIDNMNSYGTGWFKFNETSGNATDSKGTAVGTITGATRVIGWDGKGSALSFDGVDDFVTFNSSIAIPIGNKSIRLRVKSPTPPLNTHRMIFGNTRGVGFNGIRLGVRHTSGIPFLYLTDTSGAILDINFGTVNVCDNQWHDILITFDSSNIVKLYIDDLRNQITESTLLRPEGIASDNFEIGRRVVHNDSYFNFQIDELEIYNNVISVISDKALILHGGVYKYYTTSWQTIGATVTELDYKTKGMEDISSIPESAWSGLTGSVELTLWSDFQPKSEAQFNIETTPFTLADEFKGKEVKVLEYTDNPSQVESKVETEVEPYSIYDEFGDTMEVLYYTDDTAKTKADLEITANYSPLDELDEDFEVVTWSNAIDEVVQKSTPQLSTDVVQDGTVYATPLNLENVVKVK